MTIRHLAVALCLAVVWAPAVGGQLPAPATPGQPAQVPTAKPSPAPAVQVAPPRRDGQPINVKVEVTITDQRGGGQALRKTVTVVTGDGLSGFIRSSANYSGIGPVPLNLDIEPALLADNKVRLRVNLQYALPAASSQAADMPGAGALRTTEIHENLGMILDSGRPLVVAQSADPVGDRQVTIEVKATVLR
jgi:hypothetical protein